MGFYIISMRGGGVIEANIASVIRSPSIMQVVTKILFK